MSSPRSKALALVAVPAGVLVLGGGFYAEHRYEQHDVRTRAEAITGGNSERGRALFNAYGCGGCHSVGGVPQARGLVGPPLDGIGVRATLGGRLANTPSNMMRWIGNPQSVAPGTAMPNLGVGEADRRDIAAFLYTRT